MATKQIILPIIGMTCANCVATVERNLKKEEGVEDAQVNLSSERATVEFNSDEASLEKLIARVERAGYGVAEGQVDLALKSIKSAKEAEKLQTALESLEGVRSVAVDADARRVSIRYIPTLVSQGDLRKAVSSTGLEAIADGEKIGRAHV